MHPEFTPKEIAWFWSRVDGSGGPDACWPWRGTKWDFGYGRFKAKDRVRPRGYAAHRVAFYLTHGRWPEPCGLHECDNPPCCNPAHIWEGSKAENNVDCVKKGRRNTPLGERVHWTKLVPKDVYEIRALADAGVKDPVIAAKYGIHRYTVSVIRRRINWAHLPEREVDPTTP